jgi:hypothetical protein
LANALPSLALLNRLIGRDVTFAGDVGADEWKHVVFLALSPWNERAESLRSTKVKRAFLPHASWRTSYPFFVLNVGGMNNRIGRD